MQRAMRAFRNSTLFLLVLAALSCQAYPSSGSRNDHRIPSNVEETKAEILAELIDRIQGGSVQDNWNDDRWKEYLDQAEENRMLDPPNQLPFGQSEIEDPTSADKAVNLLYDNEIDKRAISSVKYNYHRCYFNPVTCYRK